MPEPHLMHPDPQRSVAVTPQASATTRPGTAAGGGPAPAPPGPLSPDRPAGLRSTLQLHVLFPCLLADVASVLLGVVTYSQLVGPPGATQMALAAVYVTIAGLMDVTHVRKEWNYTEEFVVAIKASFAALLFTAGVGLFANVAVSRILFCTVLLAMLVLRPFAALAIDRTSVPEPTSRVALMCSDEEYDEFLSAKDSIARPSRIDHIRIEDVPSNLPTDAASQGSVAHLRSQCLSFTPTKVVIGEHHLRDSALTNALIELSGLGIQLRSFSKYFEEEFGRVSLNSLGTSWFLFDIGPLHRVGYRTARRVVDIVAGSCVGTIFLLLLPILAVIVKLDSRGSLFHSQMRSGQYGRTFTMHKIRTMVLDAEANGPEFSRPNDPRITRIGKVLRRMRIDELPQALNLLKGEMSLIGPRPERPEWDHHFREVIPFYDKRSLIKPGLTGWAQVHEGYSSCLDDTVRKLERDLYYLRYQSLGIDLRVLLATAGSVVRFRGQ